MKKVKEIINPSEARKRRLFTEYKYFYDEEIFLRMTRYEFGFWIIFVIFFFMRKVMDTCGDRKTIFDFMRPAQKNGSKVAIKLDPDVVRKAREEAMRKKK